MKKWAVIIGLIGIFSCTARGQMSFYLIDNFEDGTFSKWFVFDKLKPALIKPPLVSQKDLVAESCGEYSLKLNGETKDWYVGGLGANVTIDASEYSRFQLDVFGAPEGGKIKIELYEDDNDNSIIEQDESKNWSPTKDDIWSVEIPVLGPGWTRFSIPFTALADANPKIGDDIFNPYKINESGGLLRVQIIFIANQKEAAVNSALDNILLSY